MPARRTQSPPYPLAEIFGYPPGNHSLQAQEVRDHKWCPFHNPSGPDCTKDKIDDPLGVCSIMHNNAPVITCPIRFRQDNLIVKDAERFFFPNQPKDRPARVLSEVSLPDAHGKSAGNIDMVLVTLDDNGYITDYGALEIQAVYISGNVRGVFREYMSHQADYVSHWHAENYPRPDYLSSSRKRLVPQLLFKGSILRQWNRKMAVAVQRSFFQTLPLLEPVDIVENPEKAELAWMIYDLQPGVGEDGYSLVLTETIYTEFDKALITISTPQIGDERVFLNRLQQRMTTKTISPDNSRLANPFATAEEDENLT
jgi:hypothetical protein